MPKLPKSWLPKPTRDERHAEIMAEANKIIKKAMIDNEIKHQQEVGALVGLDKHTTSRKFNGKTPWTYKELLTLIEELKIPPKDVLAMLGMKKGVA